MKTQNKLHSAIEANETAFGVQIATLSEALIEVSGDIGFEFAWLDLEHKGPSPYDSDALESLVRAAEVSGISLLVRLPNGEPDLIKKVLDTGIRNLIVPQVETANDVRKAIKATQFIYDGKPGHRGASFSRANKYGSNTIDFAKKEDRSVCLGVMIENAISMKNIDEILSVPGLGFVRIGPGDMSISLGHPIDKSHPEVTQQIEYLEKKTDEHNVPISRGFSDVNNIQEAVDKGYQFITVGRDISAVRSLLGNRLSNVKSNI